jgi:hypothetical protein
LKTHLLLFQDVGLLYTMDVGFLQGMYGYASTENTAQEDRGTDRKEAAR